MEKTNALRALDKAHISYAAYTYSAEDGAIDGISVASKINKDPKQVFKTIVLISPHAAVYVMVVNVADEIDLKKAAIHVHEKKLDLLPVKELLKTTGYIRGGCSPIGMKKEYPLYIDESCTQFTNIICSGGKIGLQIELSLSDLMMFTHAQIASLKKENPDETH